MLRKLATHTSTLGRLPLLGKVGWLRSALGAVLGIGCSASAGWLMLGANGSALPWLVAPIGASAVLVFAVPASPLAQPWPVIGGNLISAFIGFVMTHLFGPGITICALSVGLAIAAMSLAHCLHPPGGACALLAPLGASAAMPGAFVLTLTINVLLLACVAWVYNHLTGHPWPHRLTDRSATDPAAAQSTRSDLDAVLDEWDEVLDVDRDDLLILIRAVEQRAIARNPAR